MWWTLMGALAGDVLDVKCPPARGGPRAFQVHRSSGRGVDLNAARIELIVAGGVAMGRLTGREPAEDQVWRWQIPEGPVDQVLGERIYTSILDEPASAVLATEELPAGLHELARAQGLGCGPIPVVSRERATTVPNPWGGAPLAATELLSARREGTEILVTRYVTVEDEVWRPAIPREDDLAGPPPKRGDVSWVEGVRLTLIATFDTRSGELLEVQANRYVHGGQVHDEGTVTLRAVPASRP